MQHPHKSQPCLNFGGAASKRVTCRNDRVDIVLHWERRVLDGLTLGIPSRPLACLSEGPKFAGVRLELSREEVERHEHCEDESTSIPSNEDLLEDSFTKD